MAGRHCGAASRLLQTIKQRCSGPIHAFCRKTGERTRGVDPLCPCSCAAQGAGTSLCAAATQMCRRSRP